MGGKGGGAVGVITNSNNTLPSNSNSRITIGAIMESKNGTLWFGTNNGVYIFKENLFSAFLNNDSIVNKSSLQLKSVERMLEDKNGNIWFCSGMGGEEGVCRYDGKFITRYKPNGDAWVPYILEDKTGNIWFSGRNHGYFRYDGKTFTDFTENIGFSLIAEEKAGNNVGQPQKLHRNLNRNAQCQSWLRVPKGF